MNRSSKTLLPRATVALGIATGLLALSLNSCEPAASRSQEGAAPVAELPALQLETRPAVTYHTYAASLEGARDVEIRPQVSGTLERILVDEGAAVKKGQPLFQIDDALYAAALRHAEASLQSARASLEKAEINLAKLEPLVQHQVVSSVQLAEARAARDAAKAAVAQATAEVATARVREGYTLIKAPVSGYIGRIRLKQGSLVGPEASEPLTTLSAADQLYAYFSMSESDYLAFRREYPGATLEEKIRQVPPVSLLLGDDSLYDQKGRVEAVLGSFDKTRGTIALRAAFPNPNGLLRSGITGKVQLPRHLEDPVVIPQASTYEMQDRVMVYTLGKGNRVESKSIDIVGRSGHYYLVGGGIHPGDRIILTGLEKLRDGQIVRPSVVPLDSLLQQDPL